MKIQPVYVEIDIRAPLGAVMERTLHAEHHARWDLRFSRIDYLPRANESDPQRFHFTTRIGFGVKISGQGAFVGTRAAADGTRSAALRFWSSDPRSLVRSGSGYWRYIPNERGTTFATRFNYETRFGRAGALADRLVFRPLVSWATAWSFDRLRLWLEHGIQPEVSLRRLLPRAGRCRRSRR